jgi:hypothetical protein
MLWRTATRLPKVITAPFTAERALLTVLCDNVSQFVQKIVVLDASGWFGSIDFRRNQGSARSPG